MIIQILHLPPIPGEPAPFALVLSEMDSLPTEDDLERIQVAAPKLGARGVIAMGGEVEIR